MSEGWVRYKHKLNRAIEYDVEIFSFDVPNMHIFEHEPCYRIRTVRNISFPEEVHQPAYTMMPADRFHEVYEEAV